MEEVAEALAEQCAAGRPLVIMNAPFDLTLLDRELRATAPASLGQLPRAAIPLRVLDPGSWTSIWTATARAGAP